MSMVGNYLIVSAAELDRLNRAPESIETFLDEQREDENVYIDKAWAAIHFTLTGSQWEGDPPLANVVMGGELIGEVDVGYGPASGMDPEIVKETYEALKEIDESKFRSMVDVEMLNKNEIYPSVIWSRDETAIDYIAGYYRDVLTVFREAAKRECALIVFLN